MRWTARALATALACSALVGPGPAAEPAKKEAGPANRLAKESSPYLLQHAHNPVDWFPWGPEAFAKAKKEGKLVFLSIGYSSCHWCHVMERESFSDKEVAAVLNKHFVCIKVDREERPDVDEIYMSALHVMGARGGWPLSMFLTADARPIIGGTYWPKEDRQIEGETALGFKSVLNKIIELHRDKPKALQEQAEHFAERTQEVLDSATRGLALAEFDRSLVTAAAEALKEEVDPVHGGIGSKARRHKGTKFPMPSAVGLLLLHAERAKDKELAALVALTLEKMALGGIYDHLGGGFHRYSTERTWTVPHFEKMLYDNAQLVELYARAHRADPNLLYDKVIRETLGFVRREMTSPDGAFYSALDADSDGKEGEFYVWTPEKVEKVLADKGQVALVRAAYGLSGNPNFEGSTFILKLSRPLSEVAKEQNLTEVELEKRLSAARAKLLEHRNTRNRPFLDTKVLTAWNGQMIAGYALAGQVLKEPEYVKTAAKAADFVLKNLRTKDGRLLRTYSVRGDGKPEAKLNAYLDDYAFLTHGLLNLYEATGEQRWLDEARALTDTMLKWHGDGDKGGYFFTSSDHEKLFARPKDHYDGAQPSGNSVVARNLVRLWRATGDDGYRAQAEKSFRQFVGVLKGNGSGVPALAAALSLYLDARDQPSARPAAKKAEPSAAKVVRSDSVVKLTATAEKPDAQGRQTIKVTLAVDKPWHVYANPVGHKELEPAQTTVTISMGGKEVPAAVEYPKGKPVKDAVFGDYATLEGTIEIRAVVTRLKGADGPLEVTASVQACDEKHCLLPAKLKASIK